MTQTKLHLDIVEYDEPITTMWCKIHKSIKGRNGCMNDVQCLENARGQCDKDPGCYGVSWYPNNIGQKLKLCLSRDMVPKNDGWRTIMKGNHTSISFSFNLSKNNLNFHYVKI